MQIVLKNAMVYSPKKLGKKDILVVDGVVSKIEDEIQPSAWQNSIDLKGKIITPMFFDGHEHLIGQKPKNINDFLSNGIGAVVGVMMNETNNKPLKQMLTNVKYLNKRGIDAYMLTGGKNFLRQSNYPLLSLYAKGCVQDILKYNEVRGIKTALSSKLNVKPNNPTKQELTFIAKELVKAQQNTNKHLQLHIHLDKRRKRENEPADEDNLFWLDDIVATTGLKPNNIKITHIHKFPQKVEEYSKKGYYLDFTATTDNRIENLANAIKNKKVNKKMLSISSDCYTLSKYNDGKNGEFSYLNRSNLQYTLKKLVKEFGCKLEQVLPLLTTNVANSLGVGGGKIEIGCKAKINIFDKDLNLTHLVFGNYLYLDVFSLPVQIIEQVNC